MKKISSSFVGSGSFLMVASLLYILFNLTDRGVLFGIPVIMSGVAIIAVYLFMPKTPILKPVKRQNPHKKG